MSKNWCESITADLDNILVDCELTKGAENYGFYIPVDWIDKSATKVVGNVITELVTKNNKAFKAILQRLNAFEDTATALNAGTYANAFDNTFAFKIFGNDADYASIIDQLKDGEYVFVIFQKNQSKFENDVEKKVSTIRVYGYDNGAKMTACDNNVWDADLKNGWALQFTEEEAPHSAMYLAYNQYTNTLFPYKDVIEG